MTGLLWDENTSHHILRGLRLARPELNIVTVQQLGLTGADDDVVLSRAHADGRILVTHDRTTIPACVASRMRAATGVPGVIIVRLEQVSTRSAIDALVFVIDAAEPSDWQYPIFIP